ncbi:MAG: TIM barrel protein [Gemmatimonadales bacterium]|nr:TIM barrel protein [Gemmatimonadales bacterium]
MSPTRRDVLKAGAGAALVAAGVGRGGGVARAAHAAEADSAAVAGGAPAAPPYRQSVARWCFSRMPLDELCREARRIGLSAIDLLGENEWEVPRAHGLVCAVANGPGPIPDGWNRPDLHDKLVAESERLLPLVARAGVPQMIVFSGNRRGMSDGDGIANCAAGLRRIMPAAERHGVTVVMEMLNSKVDHKDYHADRTEWAAQVARAVGSPRFKLLYDVYHMQIMEGDVVRTIGQYAPLIGHYHTAGVPGRHELDDTQELNYGRIARAIAATGFTGFVAHEFIPTRDPIAKLAEAHAIFAA